MNISVPDLRFYSCLYFILTNWIDRTYIKVETAQFQYKGEGTQELHIRGRQYKISRLDIFHTADIFGFKI